MFNKICVIFIVIIVSGCSNPLDELNKHFPKTTLHQQQMRGLVNARNSLDALKEIDLLLQLDANLLLTELQNRVKEQYPELKESKLYFEHQALRMELAVSDKLEDGTMVSGIAHASASIALDQDAITVLPAFTYVEFTEITDGPMWANDVTRELVNFFVKNTLERLNGILEENPQMVVKLPMRQLYEVDMKAIVDGQQIENLPSATEVSGQGQATFKIYARSIVPNFQQDMLQIAIDLETGDGQIQALVPEKPNSDLDANAVSEYSEVYDRDFQERIHESNITLLQVNALVLGRQQFARLISESMSGMSLCGRVDVTQQNFHVPDSPLKPFENTTVLDCTPTRDCTFTKSHDDRSCGNVCIVYKPKVCAFGGCIGGGCLIRGNDPICEAAKAGQNVIYETDYATKKADCERLKKMEKDGCEINKEWLKRVRNIGKIGVASVDGVISGNGSACLNKIDFGEAIDKAILTFTVGATFNIDSRVSFTPHDAGHVIACVAPWTRNVNTKIAIYQQQFKAGGAVKYEQDGDSLKIKLIPKPISATAKVDPSPIAAVFNNNPELKLVCPLIGTVTMLNDILETVGQGSDDFAFTGNYEDVLESDPIITTIGSKTIQFGGQTLKGVPSFSKDYLYYQISQ